MAKSARAMRAQLFMQQCRQRATAPARQPNFQPTRRITDSSSLNPDNFGRKMRLSSSSPDAAAGTLQSQSTPTVPSRANDNAPRPNPYDFPRARDQPIPRYKHTPAMPSGFLSFLKYRLLRFPEPPNPHDSAKPSFNVLTNPYRARKTWPPILSQMSEIQQFHYEKKFRRRLLRKTYSLRTNWDRWALFLRRFSIGTLLFYFAFIAEPRDPNTRVPPDGLRYWMYGKLRRGNGEELGGTGTHFWPRRFGNWIEKQYHYYKIKHKSQWDPYNHDGWDERRPINSLPRPATPNMNRPLDDPTRDLS